MILVHEVVITIGIALQNVTRSHDYQSVAVFAPVQSLATRLVDYMNTSSLWITNALGMLTARSELLC